MTARDFAYWLQGFFELQRAGMPSPPAGDPFRAQKLVMTEDQVKCVEAHLALVFQHDIDPQTELDPEKAAKLQAIHDEASKPKPPSSAVTPGDPNVVYRC